MTTEFVVSERTWPGDATRWKAARLETAIEVLSSLGVSDPCVARMALAHWSLETGHGRDEWNFNVGNLICAGFAECHVGHDSGNRLWRAYRTAEAGIRGYFGLLAGSYRDAWTRLRACDVAWFDALSASAYFGTHGARDAARVAEYRGVLAAQDRAELPTTSPAGVFGLVALAGLLTSPLWVPRVYAA